MVQNCNRWSNIVSTLYNCTCCSKSSQTVLLRTTLTRAITLHRLMSCGFLSFHHFIPHFFVTAKIICYVRGLLGRGINRGDRFITISHLREGRQRCIKELWVLRCVIYCFRMSELIQNRQRSPWLWNGVLYSLTPSGREHNKCLTILHDFTNKVIKLHILTFVKVFSLLGEMTWCKLKTLLPY